MIYFLYGEDNFRSQEKLIELKQAFLAKNHSGSALSVLDYGDKQQAKNLHETLSSGGLFSKKKLAIISGAIGENEATAQNDILTELKKHSDLQNSTDLIVIFWEKNSPKKNGRLFKALLGIAKKEEFAPLKGSQLNAWIIKKLKLANPALEIEQPALAELIIACGNESALLALEIQKFACYKFSGKINKVDVLTLVKAKVSANIFETIEVLCQKNKPRALHLFHKQLATGEDAFYILSMYVYQVRNLLKISDLLNQGISSPQLIAGKARLHPFVVQKSLPTLRNFSLSDLTALYAKLSQIDLAAKTGNSTAVLEIDKLLASI